MSKTGKRMKIGNMLERKITRRRAAGVGMVAAGAMTLAALGLDASSGLGGGQQTYGSYDYILVQSDSGRTYEAYDNQGNQVALDSTPDVGVLLNTLFSKVASLQGAKIYVSTGSWTYRTSADIANLPIIDGGYPAIALWGAGMNKTGFRPYAPGLTFLRSSITAENGFIWMFRDWKISNGKVPIEGTGIDFGNAGFSEVDMFNVEIRDVTSGVTGTLPGGWNFWTNCQFPGGGPTTRSVSVTIEDWMVVTGCEIGCSSTFDVRGRGYSTIINGNVFSNRGGKATLGVSVGTDGDVIFVNNSLADNWIPSFTLGGTCTIANNHNINDRLTTLTGTSGGSATWSMPLQSTGYKRVLVRLETYWNAGVVPQTVEFPVEFTAEPVILIDASRCASASVSGLSLPTAMCSPVTGWIVIEGY